MKLREENERLVNDKIQLNLRWEETAKEVLEAGKQYHQLKSLADEMEKVLISCMPSWLPDEIRTNKRDVLKRYREFKAEKL